MKITKQQLKKVIREELQLEMNDDQMVVHRKSDEDALGYLMRRIAKTIRFLRHDIPDIYTAHDILQDILSDLESDDPNVNPTL